MSICRGDIFHSNAFTFVDHGKFFAILGEDSNNVYGCFFINSDINRYLYLKPKMLELQVGLGPDEYPFLKHNSYINCAQIIKIPKVSLKADIESGVAKHKGKLSQADINTILELVNKSDVFSDADKEFFQ